MFTKVKKRPYRMAFWLIALVLVAASNLAARGVTYAQTTPGDEFWDQQFGLVGVEGEIEALAQTANGDLYVGGDFQKAGGLPIKFIARWDGITWHPLGNGVDGEVTALAADGNKLYVAGEFAIAGEVVTNRIAVWDGTEWSVLGNGDGPVDDYFGTSQPGQIYALTVVDGLLYAGGDFVSIDGVDAYNIAVWNGTNWSALGEGLGKQDWEDKFVGEGKVLSILAHGDTLFVGGDFTHSGNLMVNSIAAWDGQQWLALAGGMTLDSNGSNLSFATVEALAIFQNELYAGGGFDLADGKAISHFARWDGTTWHKVGSGIRTEMYDSDPGVTSLAINAGRLYLGGHFATAGGKTIDLIAHWDGTNYSEVGAGIDNEGYDVVKALLPAADGGLYIAGSYRFGGGLRADNIAHWSGTTWRALGGGLAQQPYSGDPAHPYAIAVDDDGRIYVGGDFRIAGGLQVKNLAMWEAGSWHDIGGTNDRVRAMIVVGNDLYIAGDFTQVGDIAANHIARYNRTTNKWSTLGNGINGTVRALAFHDGLLYAGGGFTSAGQVTAYDVAFWDGTTWHPFGTKARIFERSQEGGEIGTYVNALAVTDDRVYIGGHFQTIQFGTNISDLNSFVVTHNLVAWDPQNDEWGWVGTPLNPGVTDSESSGLFVEVNALALIGDMLYVGGGFNQAGTVAANNLARYNVATGTWSVPNGSVGGFSRPTVYALAVYGSDLFVGGHFTTAGPVAARFVARLDTLTDTWSTLGSGVKWSNDEYTEVDSLATAASGVYVGGKFTSAGGVSAPGFARWTGSLAAGDVTPEKGGTVQGPQGLAIQFPAGAANEGLLVRLTGLTEPSKPLPTTVGLLRAFNGAATTATGDAISQFLKPYTLKVPYTAEQLAAAGVTDPSTLNVHYWDGTAWRAMLPCTGCGVDTANRVVTVVADHFTEFVLVGTKGGNNPNPNPNPNPAPQGNKVFLPLIKGN
jgi:hypothetical protein